MIRIEYPLAKRHDLLSGSGLWLAYRLPKLHIDKNAWNGAGKYWRLFAFKPYYRFIVFDLTYFAGKWHFTFMNMRIIKRIH